MKIFKSNPILRKLCLSIAIATVGVVGQSAWGCQQVDAALYYYTTTEYGCLSDGLAHVKQNGKYGYVDKTGNNIIIPAQYESVSPFRGGLAHVKQNGKWGFIDTTGKVIVPFEYDDGSQFYEGLAYAKKNGKYGYIDPNGKTVIDFKYDDAFTFENGKAKVASNDDKTPKYFYIDKTGKVLTTRTSLTDFRKKLEQGDDVSYQTNDGSGKGMIFEIKGNLVQVQTKESQCSQRDYRGNCQNYIENQVGKWVKKSEVYPTNHFD